MSLYTAQDYVDHIRMIVGKSPDYVMTDSVILDLFDRKIMRYMSEYPFNQFTSTSMFNTSDGTAEYSIDDDSRVLVIREMTNVNTGMKMIKMDRKDYEIYSQGSLTARGAPTHWFTSGYDSTIGTNRKIYLWQTPNGDYAIRYVFLKGHELLHLTPSPNYGPFSALWDDALIYGVAGDVFAYIDPEKAAPYYQLESNALSRAYNAEFTPSMVTARPGRAVHAGIKV